MGLSPIPSGNAEFDTLLGGGLAPRVITQFYGGPGCGKSTLCVLIATTVLRSGRGVVFLDTEGFSVERFRQVAGGDAEACAERLFLFEPLDFEEQGVMIGKADAVLSRGGIGLIVLDSATGLYRTRVDGGKEVMQRLAGQMVHLLGLAKRYDIPALITNQVYLDSRTNTLLGLGGVGLAHISKVIVRIDRESGGRRAVLMKHRSRPCGDHFDFVIVEEGIQSIGAVPTAHGAAEGQ
ncbi:MAG: DNA repair and recombination protein RadB [Methanomicrobiales archaeon]|jgi:DNA repair protein RadB|nr:DNA repair and recombination protein RadB [Methanomicrobiales archaeon]